MPHVARTARFSFRPHLWLINFIGLIVPRRLRADWRQEWEAELRFREVMLAEWDRLDWRNKLDLLRRSLGAFWDALVLQPRRLEDEMFQDLHFGLRMMLKHKVLTSVAILSLALGIGANSAIFSVVNAVMLRPLPYASPDALVKVMQTPPDPAKPTCRDLSYPRFQVLRDQSPSLWQSPEYSRRLQPTGTHEPERLKVRDRIGELLPAARGGSNLGRSFTPKKTRRRA